MLNNKVVLSRHDVTINPFKRFLEQVQSQPHMRIKLYIEKAHCVYLQIVILNASLIVIYDCHSILLSNKILMLLFPLSLSYFLAYSKIKLHKKPCLLPRESPLPSVSILKPLMGVDPNLSPNLETFFTMQYPSYELLFCIEDKEDPAVAIVNNLIDKYPKVDAHLYLGGSKVGVNPKINNLNAGYVNAKHELIMISDSGIRMKEDTLLDMVQHMKEGIALVHQLPFTCDREGFAATFEKIYFGTYQARMYLTADLFGAICHTGMSSLIRRDVLEEIGGLQAFGCYLAEDFFLAKSISEAGWKSAISSQPAWQNSGICDVTSFQLRLTRWAKLRVAMVPHLIILEPLRYVRSLARSPVSLCNAFHAFFSHYFYYYYYH